MESHGTKNISEKDIRFFLKDLFDAIACPKTISTSVIEGLIETSLRGVDSHGIRLAAHYAQAALIGRINLSPKFRWKKTSAATAMLDADNAFGIVASSLAMKKAIELAKQSGVGCVAVYHSSHFGAAAIYSLMAARDNMIGLSFTSVDSLVLPFGGKSPFLGTNPICFAVPCQGEDPFCLDMSTSLISWNKLLQYRRSHKSLEEGWAADKSGKMCTDADLASALLPIGGYKGYGLALMVEILTSVLTGMPYGKFIPKMYPLSPAKRDLAHFLMAIDIAKFQSVALFKRRVKGLLHELRSTPPAQGFDRVRVANDPEKEAYRLRKVKGIPLSQEELESFREVAEKVKIQKKKHPWLTN